MIDHLLAATPMAILSMSALTVDGQQVHRVPTNEQRPVGGEWSCHVADLPSPLETAKAVPERPGFMWLPGHYRCVTGIWEHVQGRWSPMRPAMELPVESLVSWNANRLEPAPGFEFFLHSWGTASLRPTEAVLENVIVKGEFDCQCLGRSGSCSARVLASGALACRSNRCDITCIWQLEVNGELRASVVMPGGEQSC